MPDKKFRKDGLVGLIRSGQPTVFQMARHLPHQHTKFISRLDRLKGNLASSSNFDQKVKEALQQI